MLDLCLNRNLGDNIRPVNGVFQGVATFVSRIFDRGVNLLEMRFPFIAIATAALWFAFGDCVILRDGKEACVVLLVGVRVRRVAS